MDWLPTRSAPAVTHTDLLIVVLLCAGSLSCGKPAWETTVSWGDDVQKTLPEQSLFPDEGAVVVFDDGRVEVRDEGPVQVSVAERHRIVKVFNRRGLDYSYVVIPYRASSEVTEIRARTIAPDGTITVLNEENVFDVSLYPNYVFFSDQRAKLFTFPAVYDGAVLEYRYSMTVHGRGYWNVWTFQDRVPTLRSRFTLVVPSRWPVETRQYGIVAEPTVQRYPTIPRSTYVWDVYDIPALVTEYAMPSENELTARIAFRPPGFANWRDVGGWYKDVVSSRMVAGENIVALARQLTEGETGREARLRRIFEWVRDHIRYVAVTIGIGGYQPHPAEEVYRNLYGDCKDMVTFLCALSAAAGVEARPALISTWQNGLPDTTLPSAYQFNHVIACARGGDGERTIWMDATDKGCPFGLLPWYDQGLPTLLIDEGENHCLVQTPRATARENCQSSQWRADLDETGGATVEGSTIFIGAPATELRGEMLTASRREIRQYLELLLAGQCSGAVLDTFEVDGLEPVADSLLFRFRFWAPGLATLRESVMVVRPAMPAASRLPDYFRSAFRSHPVRLKFGFSVNFSMEVRHPRGWVAEPGRPDSILFPFGSGAWKLDVENGSLLARSSFELAGNDIRSTEYEEFRRFLDMIRKRNRWELVLHRDGRAR